MATATKTLDLSGYYGSETVYRHMLGVRYTEGVKAMAEQAGAYWLIDAIASYQISPKVRRNEKLQEIQFWSLTVTKEGKATLECVEDAGRPAVIRQRISSTDFPVEGIKLYLAGGVLMLPSEY